MNKNDENLDLCAPEIIFDKEDSNNGLKNELTQHNLESHEEHLISKETLRESPVQWPERLPGLNDFLAMSDTPIHQPNVEQTPHLTSENIAKMNEFAKMTPDELCKKIKSMHDEIYELGVREAKEIKRGKLLGIFDRKT